MVTGFPENPTVTDMGDVAQVSQVAQVVILCALIVLGLVKVFLTLGRHLTEQPDDEFDLGGLGTSDSRERGSGEVEESVEGMVGRSNEEWLARRREQDLFRRKVTEAHVDKGMASSSQAGGARRRSRISHEALERQRNLRISQGRLSARFDGNPNRRDEAGIIEARAREQRQERKEQYRNERFFKRNSSGL